MNIESIKMAIIDFTAIPDFGLYIGCIIIFSIFCYKLRSEYCLYIHLKTCAERNHQCIDDDYREHRLAMLDEPRQCFWSRVKFFTLILVISLLAWTLIFSALAGQN